MGNTYKILVTTEDIKENVTVDEYLDLLDNKARTLVEVLSRFLSTEEGARIPYDEARKIMGGLPLQKLNDLAGELLTSLDGGAANFQKGNG